MILKRISILNYKNLEEVELGFSAKLNCFFGQNGMGKTNLLDAVYFLSFCKSSGNPIDSQNIRHEQDFFVIQGFYEAEDGTPEEIYKKPENTFVAGFIGVSNFVECDVKGDDPNQAVLDIKGECSITCTLKKPFTGKGIISARPEQLFFDDKEGLPGTIIISTFLGDFIEYEILLDNGQTVQLNEYTKDVHELRPDGQKVKVNFDIRAVGVYDAATQEVISW